MITVAVAVLFVAGDKEAAEVVATAHHLRATQDLWIETGVMEERERENYFNRPWAFAFDHATMVDRVTMVTASHPPFSDRAWLPPYEVAWGNREVCREYLKWLTWIRPWRTPQEQSRIDAVEGYVVKSMVVWSCIADIQSPYQRLGARFGLDQLRTLVGKEVYESKVWPPPIPESVDPDEYESPPPEEVYP